MSFPLIKQYDTMQCGISCLAMICHYFGKEITLQDISQYCFTSKRGTSMLGISEAAKKIGLSPIAAKLTLTELTSYSMPCILYWDQKHFVVLYKHKHKEKFYIADPDRGLLTYNRKDFELHWLNTQRQDERKGIALFIQPTDDFHKKQNQTKTNKWSFKFLFGYVRQYRRYFGQILLGALVGCLLQLVFPFLTQAIVDVGIEQRNLNIIYLILLGQLMLTVSRTAVDFIRRWILLHISVRINISLVSDFFIKLLKLPMSFFDTKLMGDLLQRMGDHSRVEKFLTNQMLNVAFSLLGFLVFGGVLFSYNLPIFLIFLTGSLLYGGWIAFFLKKRKQLDYLFFERQAANNSKTYQFITSMQEIKLQDCEQRRRWEWEDVQADLFDVNQKQLKLKQTQEAGSVFINEVKNILITITAATAVVHGEMTLGMMLAVQYIIGQLNSPVEQLMSFLYSLQDVKISLERINEIHGMENEESRADALTEFADADRSLYFRQVDFKYDPHHPWQDTGRGGCGDTTRKGDGYRRHQRKRKDDDDKTTVGILSSIGRKHYHR